MSGGSYSGWGSTKKSAWYRELRARMVVGLERCRMCGRTARHDSVEPGGLHVGHIRARSGGGPNTRDNLTVVCTPCDRAMGDEDWTGVAPSLLDDTWTPPWADLPRARRAPEALTHTPVLPARLLLLGSAIRRERGAGP